MWSAAARQASIEARRSSGDTAAPVAPAPAHQAATNSVPRDMAASQAAADAAKASAQASAQMAQAGRGGVDRSPPTNYRAPSYGTYATDPGKIMRDYSEKGNGGERQSTYQAPKYQELSEPSRRIADYSDKTADQGSSAGVTDRLSARYSQ